MRLLICAGGTGGGVYPALAVLQTLSDKVDSVLWVGGEGGMEAEMINRLNIPYVSIPAAGLHGVSLSSLPSNILRLIRGYFESRKILASFKPDVLLFTGGFVAVPMAIAGIKFQSLLYVPDIEPGLAIKAIARFSDRIAVTVQDTLKYFRYHRSIQVTGYPTRPDLSHWNHESALNHFGLHPNKPVLLIFGGSKGAQSINQALFENIESILEMAQIIHITGTANFDDAEKAKNNLMVNKNEYHPFPFLHEDMGAAFSAADLAVCRAGASILGELPLFGLPAILVPYPYAWRYQKINADYLVNNHSGVLIQNDHLKSDLLTTLQELLEHPQTLKLMSEKMKLLATPQAAQNLAEILQDLATAKYTKKDNLS